MVNFYRGRVMRCRCHSLPLKSVGLEREIEFIEFNVKLIREGFPDKENKGTLNT